LGKGNAQILRAALAKVYSSYWTDWSRDDRSLGDGQTLSDFRIVDYFLYRGVSLVLNLTAAANGQK
jgi:hypothetical protein